MIVSHIISKYYSFFNLLLKNHSELHPRQGRGNQIGCKECTFEIYNIFHPNEKKEWDNSVSNWVSLAKKRGEFISFINSFIEDSDLLEVSCYFDGTLDSLDYFSKIFNDILQNKTDSLKEKMKRLIKHYL